MADRGFRHQAELLLNPCHYYREYTSYGFPVASQAIKYFFYQKMMLYVIFSRYVENLAIFISSTLTYHDKPDTEGQHKNEFFAASNQLIGRNGCA